MMNKDSSDVSMAFGELIKEGQRALSTGLPKMNRLNTSIDLQFLRYKLRLQIRMILYARFVGEKSVVDLTEEDFGEVQKLIARRPELLGTCPVVNTFWRQVQLLREDRGPLELSSAQYLVAYFDTYSSPFSQDEAEDFVEIMAGFINRLVNEGRNEFSHFSLLLGLRIIELRFRGKKKANPDEYLSGMIYANLGLRGLAQLHHGDVNKLLEIIDFDRRDSIHSIRDWFESFTDHFAKYLDPADRKMYRDYLWGGICFHYEDYIEAIKVYSKLSIPKYDIANLAIKRCLFCASYSIIYHGTTTERRLVRRRKLNLDLQIDRMRKHLEYLSLERPEMNYILKTLSESFRELRKLYSLRQMVEKGAMSTKMKERYLRQKALIDPSVFGRSVTTKKWLEGEFAALP
jgi:hypothetical protein